MHTVSIKLLGKLITIFHIKWNESEILRSKQFDTVMNCWVQPRPLPTSFFSVFLPLDTIDLQGKK